MLLPSLLRDCIALYRVFATLKSYGVSNKDIISATQGFSSKVLKGA